MRIIAETCSHVVVPDSYKSHALVAGRVFYTLPLGLLQHLKTQCGVKAFDADALKMEHEAANPTADNFQFVGYDRGEGFTYSWLDPGAARLPEPTDEALCAWRTTREKFEPIKARMAKELEAHCNPPRGYLGWLLTNPEFLQERDQLFTDWAAEIAEWGVPRSGPTLLRPPPEGGAIQTVSGRTKAFLDAFARFCQRWRLRHFITRELPEPLAPQTPPLLPVELLTVKRVGAVATYQPDTVPIPSRGDLRDDFRNLWERNDGKHLREWKEIIAPDRHNDHTIHLYAQIFTLQHYWRVLEQRHPRLVQRPYVLHVHVAFGKYLHVSPAAVDKYCQTIRRRLRARSQGT